MSDKTSNNTPEAVPSLPSDVTPVKTESVVETKHMQSAGTLVTISNALELVSSVSEKLLGGEVANTFSGAPMGRGLVQQLALSSFQKNLAMQIGG